MSLITITLAPSQNVKILASSVVAIADVATDTSTAQSRVYLSGGGYITLPMTADEAATALGL